MNEMFESYFELNPFSILEEFDPCTIFNFEAPNFDEILYESKVSEVFSKIMQVIRKGLDYIRRAASSMVQYIKRIFVGDKKKPVGAIAADIGMKQHDVRYYPVNMNDPQEVSNAVQSMYANMIEAFEDDSIVIDVSKIIGNNPEKDVYIKGNKIEAGGYRASEVLKLIEDPSKLDTYIYIFQQLTSDDPNNKVDATLISKLNILCKSFTGRPSPAEYAVDFTGNKIRPGVNKVYVKISELVEFQKKVDEICELGEKFDNHFNSINLKLKDPRDEKKYIEILNDLSWIIVNLQGGMHAICNALAGIYQIDPGYWRSVSDPEMLAKFADEAIKTGMPSKYIVNNIYNICTKELRGKANGSNPIMGFGRLTLLPEGDIIYKIAINRYGIRSNKNDFAVVKAVKDTNDPELINMFAETTRTYGDYIVNVMEKVKAGHSNEPPMAEAVKLGNRINELLLKHRIGFSIYDIKADAFGIKNNRYVILDYGYIHRRTINSQNQFEQVPDKDLHKYNVI